MFDKLSGYGEKTNNRGTTWKGFFAKEKLHGIIKEIDKSGKIEYQIWEQNEKIEILTEEEVIKINEGSLHVP